MEFSENGNLFTVTVPLFAVCFPFFGAKSGGPLREALPSLLSAMGKNNFRKAGGAVMRVKITLACTECKQRNYNTMKNKKNDPDRLEMNKYCRFCRKHTVHKETK